MKVMTARRIRLQVGLTLIELMVSLVLGLVLMAGVIQLFAANKTSYQLTQQISAMQENARYAMSRLERDIRMAGYTGCTSRDRDSVLINIKTAKPSTFSFESGIDGWEKTGTAHGATYSVISKTATVSDATGSGWTTSSTAVVDSSTTALDSSDVIRLWHVDGDSVLVDVSGTTLNAGAQPEYEPKDIVMLTDCANADVVSICSKTGNNASLNCSANKAPSDLLNADRSVQAFKLAGWVYFVGKRTGDTDYPNVPPALYRKEISVVDNSSPGNPTAGAAQELVEGVEALQFQYGEDRDSPPDGVADAYVDADDVSDWQDVVSVRVNMLMQSLNDNVVDGSQTFAFNGATVTASDGRLRYPFVATVSLRNRSR